MAAPRSGGLASLWLALHRPETFGAALVVSPSVWWDDRFVLRDAVAASPSRLSRLWVDMGGQEGGQAVTLARELTDVLRRRGWSGDMLRFVEDPQGRHDEGQLGPPGAGDARLPVRQRAQRASIAPQ